MIYRQMNSFAILLSLTILPCGAYAGSPVSAPTATAVLVSGSYQVTATAQLSGGPSLIPGGLNLLRVDGAAPVILGVMHDDGLRGDAVANDGIYTLLFSVASVSQVQLQASAAFRGTLLRVKSASASVQVVTPTLSQVSPNSGKLGQQGLPITVNGQNTHFSQGTTTADFGPGVTVASVTVNSANSATAVLNISAGAKLGANDVTITSGLESVTLAGAFTNVTGDVITWHYDIARTGLNPYESTLTPANVTSSSFGKLAELPVDGEIDGQILYLHQVNIPNVGVKNVVYFATEKDSVYAVDASTMSGSTATVLWKTSVLPAGETAATSLPCGPTPSGVMSTPVIDRARNAIYLVAMSQDANKTVYHRIHALDLATGAELFGGPNTITATYPGTGGNSHNGIVTFDPSHQHNRAALLENNGVIYTVWSGLNGDCGLYSPWVMTYDPDTLAQIAALDLAPGNYGGGLWGAGAGPSADSAGYVYTVTGNGFGGNPEGGLPPGSFNNSLVKLSTSGNLIVADYFAPDNSTAENQADADFGSVGAMLVDLVDNNSVAHHLAMSGGKDGQFYVVDRENMGGFSATANNVYQQFTLSAHLNFSTAVYYNGKVYLCPGSSPLKAFSISNGKLATPPAQSSYTFGGQGSVISLSSNGSANGIVWAVDYTVTRLFAFDASNLTNVYDSSMAGSRDQFSSVGGHFNTPTVADGRVYFGTGSSLVVFGLLQ
jgi:hypothetical protein